MYTNMYAILNIFSIFITILVKITFKTKNKCQKLVKSIINYYIYLLDDYMDQRFSLKNYKLII